MTTANGDPSAEDVEALIEGLFRGPRERFVADRNLAVRRLRAQGRREDAARLSAQTKPGIAAWAANQLWWAHRPQMRALLEAARRQARALQTGAGPAEQAAATLARRRALDDLLATAITVLEAAGHGTGAATMRKLSTTLEALAAHALRPGGPPLGRLTADLAPPGFELLGGLGTLVLDPEPASAPEPTPPKEDDPARTEAKAALDAVIKRRDAMRQRADQAAAALDDATAHADEATLATQRATTVLDEALARLEAARAVAQEAERESNKARSHARREHQRVDDARRAQQDLARQLGDLDEAVQRAERKLAALQGR